MRVARTIGHMIKRLPLITAIAVCLGAAAPAMAAPPKTYAQAMKQIRASKGYQAGAQGTFRTPSGNIFCSIGIENPDIGVEACELRRSTIRARTAQCPPQIGRRTIGRIEVVRRGYRAVCNTDTIWQRGAPVLRYNYVSHVRGTPVYCLSTTAGVVCANTRLKRGFFLSRTAYRIF